MKKEISREKPGWLPEQQEEDERKKKHQLDIREKKKFRTKQKKVSENDIS